MRIGIVLLWLLCACGWVTAGVPETPRFRVLGVAEGMPSSSINALARDRAGYVWIATVDGLARYDGVDFRLWRHVPDDAAALPGNIVQALHIDAQDRVWVATEFGGISMLDAARGDFRHYRRSTHPQIGSDDTWAFASRGDELWFGTADGGLHRLARDGRITRFTAEEDNLPSNTVLALAFDAAGTLWIGTDMGLARFDGKHIVAMPLPGANTSVVYSLRREDDALWIGSADGVFRREADGRWTQPVWSPMFERPNALTSIARDHDGKLWLGSQRGLWRAQANGVPVPVPLGGPGIAKGVQALLLQDDGALWVPVPGAGLGYLRSDWRRVAQFTRSPEGLSDELYRAIAPARDSGVWLGGLNGAVERLDATGAIERLGDAERERLKDQRFFSIAEDHAGRLWLGNSLGLIRIGRDGTVDEWRKDDQNDAALAGRIDHLRVAPDGTLWLSANGGGVQQRDPSTGTVLAEVTPGQDSGLGTGDTEALEFDDEGRPWIAGENGLARWDAGRKRFVAVEPMQGARVHAFAFEGADALWLHRVTGLERYQRTNGAWRRAAAASTDTGLPAVESGALRIDRAKRVWLSTSRGLYRWDPHTQVLRRFGVQHGLSSQEFVDRALAISGDGMLTATTADGSVVLVDTTAPEPHARVPDLRIDSFAVRREGHWQDWPDGRAIELSPQKHEFRVSTRLLAYDDPLANRYWTRLEGFERDWVAQDATGERVFTDLPSGDYTLRARAIDAAGNAAREQTLSFRVLPPWWKAGWATAAPLVLCAFVLWWISRTYDARLDRQHALQLSEQKRSLAEQASQAKTQFLATLGHEVRTPMTGVLGMTELLLGTPLQQKQRGYAESIRSSGQHLLRLVNDALDLARVESGKLELEDAPFDLHILLQEVCALFEPLAQAKGLGFRCESANLPRGVRGDAHRLRQMLLNLGNNAIKFTERGDVVLRATATARGVRFEVIDTGPGLSAEQQARLFRRFEQAEGARTTARYGGSGLGLAICQELAAAMGGRVEVESTLGQGATFRLDLPLPAAEIPAAQDAETRDRVAAHRILLVEDDPTVAQVLGELLQAQGHVVTHAPHGLAALAALQSAAHDLAFLDLDLPGIDGFDLARMICGQGHALPLIALTARADTDAEPKARVAGMTGFLRKPVTGALLTAAIEAALPA
ncbi:two-component regulator propeller domain-containing protein [Lysobacter sp. CFH 32150]|uniref:sensor histidine kinase n=1 Tax=Lysobacter sp. CFH 32150 TaxID=2927128 RepID=UPI001FA7E77D|nr:two-component regulator propeller domain-containing protein [Lysobacter sp. CFH 32150]MCI4568705.1 ATP-binding protein [Lysobacter sp. CFH 32150]